MREYLYALTHDEALDTVILETGDGMAISVKKNKKKERDKMRNTELLIPASSLEVLKTAVLYGADAVYIGGEMYGLRAKARNFSREDMEAGVKFAHENGVKVYVTANIVAHNEDLEGSESTSEN